MTKKILRKPETTSATVPGNILVQQFLEQNNLTLQVVVHAPEGGAVNPMNFVPAGWKISIQVVPSEQTQ